MGVIESLRWLPVVLCVSGSAAAQNEDVARPPTRHAVRPRFGVAGSGGLLLATAEQTGASTLPGEAFGLDVRGGVQFNDLFAVYLQPSMVVGTVNNACFGMTEAVLALWFPLLVDFTISDRVSLAVGGGPAAVPDEPLGWTVHFRVATYFHVHRSSPSSAVRHGLMVGLETRAYSLSASGSGYAGALVMLSLGYERF